MTDQGNTRAELAEALISAAGDGLIAIDDQGLVVFFNPAAARIFGHEPKAVLGGSLEKLFVPGMFVEHQSYVDRYLARVGSENGSTFETVGKHADGTTVPIELTLSTTTVGERRLVVASIRDIAKRRESDRRNKMLMEQLTQTQKMEALGTLAAGIAHDFNNMLGAIMGYSSAMTRELDKTHRHFTDANQILSVARRAKRLTDKLLAFSRQSDSKFEPMALNRVIQDVVALLQRTIPKNIIFKSKLDRNVYTEGDRTQLEQMLLNICLNSRDAMPDGGEILLRTRVVEIEQAEAKLPGLTPGSYCLATIRDNGIGLDETTLARVFDPFFSTKPSGEGSGLGLALVYATVKSHGGHVMIASEEGQGAEVTIYLPSTEARPIHEAPRATGRQVPGRGEQILLVDDERHLRNMAKRLLEGLGYKVILAESGEEAEGIYRQQHDAIDLVILDVVMVGISGVETLERLREIDNDVRVLVSSGYNREGEPRDLLSKEVCGFVQKPYGIEEVSQAIERALRHKVGRKAI
jgi:PAS domain S-box-containing protein